MAFTDDHLNKNLYDRDGASTMSQASVVTTISSRTYMILPTVLLAAKIHFGCGDITGVPLENELTSIDQFYWERRFFFEDVRS